MTMFAAVPHYSYLRSELSSLRRCGRALTGTQQLADISAIALMDAIIHAAPSAEPSRADLYRRYLTLLVSAAGGDAAAFADSYSPLHRQAYWLHCVEEFDETGVAQILQISPKRVRALLAAYQVDCASQPRASVLIIEDEAVIAHDLKRILVLMGHKVIGVARTRRAAIERYHAFKPTLIVSDVQLADYSSGVDAVDAIHAVARVPVVFITAFPERLLTGTREEPVYLISKPYEPTIVAAAASQALHTLANPQLIFNTCGALWPRPGPV